MEESGQLLHVLRHVRELVSPIRFGSIEISLARSENIAKFFAFSFLNVEKLSLASLNENPFYGSGVYAIYYHGTAIPTYSPISGTETPIYVGKTDPKNPQADDTESQGKVLHKRLKEHAKSIEHGNLDLKDFYFRAAPIQSGLQAAVEAFMIAIFRPIWNKEVKVCHGIGKHGDSAETRRNKRSPWDTMHPGRSWAVETETDQLALDEIVKKIDDHFKSVPPIPDKSRLYELLSL